MKKARTVWAVVMDGDDVLYVSSSRKSATEFKSWHPYRKHCRVEQVRISPVKKARTK